ncbi:MAG: hypothetical protein QXE72_07055 [Candidatus Caldarchaeum sp.]
MTFTKTSGTAINKDLIAILGLQNISVKLKKMALKVFRRSFMSLFVIAASRGK